ncbi:LysM peptidoglycan-binding domain-containing protein [Lacibacterium aquatile]|uniref:LysM peptidoglycan-binding domain-containing protein n=1 Tax=Lacibacterium aquatile TaxID=1168082 RepID=A0ABW5DQL9_9PROT
MRRSTITGGLGVMLVLAAVLVAIVANQDAAVPEAVVTAATEEPPPAAPAAPPAATQPAPEPVAPGFDVVRVNPKGDAVIAGRAAPNAAVTVMDGEKPVGTVTADKRGEWVLLPAEPLPPGNRELSLVAKDPSTGTDVPSEKVVVLAVPGAKPVAEPSETSAPPAPVATNETSIAIAVPRDGKGPVTLLQGPTTTQGASGGLTVDVIDYDSSGTLNLTGRSEPGASLRIYIDNQPAGQAEADAKGVWRLTPPEEITEGTHKLRVDRLDTAGKVAQRVELPFAKASRDLLMSGDDRVVVQPGNSLWRIARRLYGGGVQYTTIVQANPDHIKDPDLIYPGQILKVPLKN